MSRLLSSANSTSSASDWLYLRTGCASDFASTPFECFSRRLCEETLGLGQPFVAHRRSARNVSRASMKPILAAVLISLT